MSNILISGNGHCRDTQAGCCCNLALRWIDPDVVLVASILVSVRKRASSSNERRRANIRGREGQRLQSDDNIVMVRYLRIPPEPEPLSAVFKGVQSPSQVKVSKYRTPGMTWMMYVG
jgi:hypothetical protein